MKQYNVVLSAIVFPVFGLLVYLLFNDQAGAMWFCSGGIGVVIGAFLTDAKVERP